MAAGLVGTLGLLAIGGWQDRLRMSDRSQSVPVLLLPAIGLPVIVSVLLGTVHGVPVEATARASLPYVAFLPVILLGLLAGPSRQPGLVTRPLVFAGLAQSLYLLWLFLARVPDPRDIGSVWIWRTTLLDARTTLPLLLASATLPLAWRPKGIVGQLARGMVVALSFAAALSTQTRSQVLAVAVSVLVGLGLVLALGLRAHGVPWRRIGTRAVASMALAVTLAGAVLVAVPQTRALLGALVLRTQTDADTGRVADEWIPAVNAVLADGAVGLIGGIGAGGSFITASGEERTYVHNLLLYGLVYFGGPGLALLLLAYLLLLASLLRRGFLCHEPSYLALAAMVVGMLVYAQFFAVHKLFSYNLMLALAGQALTRPPASRAETR